MLKACSRRLPVDWCLGNRGLLQLRGYAKTYRNFKLNKQKKPLNFTIPNLITVNKLSNLMNCKVQALKNDLKKLGFQNVNNEYMLTREYVELILQEYNYVLPTTTQEAITSKTLYNSLRQPLNAKALQERPPIVTIMGHVDHGKTTIIDYLRKSNVVANEFGGITQHIGAFQVTTPITKKKITFLDTPGHAAFLKMRERGANVTDIIVLVIAIEDSIKPQTVEAMKHIKNSGNELIIAVTKIDKVTRVDERNKQLDKIANQLLNYDIATESKGGDVQLIPVSAKTGENMDVFEESIITLSDIMDIKTENSKSTLVQGWIIESKLNSFVGNSASVLIKKGTLQKGTVLICGKTYCKVRNISNKIDPNMTMALPSDAVEVLGWKELPEVGDEVLQVKDESTAKRYISKRMLLEETEKNEDSIDDYNEKKYLEIKQKKLKNQNDLVEENEDIDSAKESQQSVKMVNFVIKADVSGSAEAVKESIETLGNKEVQCQVISSSVGVPTENDINLASVASGYILCFNVSNIPKEIIQNALKVPVKQYNVIYNLIEDVVKILESNMEQRFEKRIIATIEIKQVFEYKLGKKILKVAGCKVLNGEITRKSKIEIVRGKENEIVFDGQISTMKRGKQDISSANKGTEFGMTFQNAFDTFKVGDKIIVYEKNLIERHL